MNRKFAPTVLVFLFLLVIGIVSARAEWSRDGVTVCGATATQGYSQIVSDDAGGAILTWSDSRNQSDTDIYAQRIDAAGDASWTADGVAICSGPGDQQFPSIISDGSGGAIIVWADSRNATSTWDIWAQRVDGEGNPLWAVNGLDVCTSLDEQSYPMAVSDGSGGAIIVWQDHRNGVDYDIYAQRIDHDGVKQWDDAGVAVCAVALDQLYPFSIADGFGGIIVIWRDIRGGVDLDIYGQRLDSSGRLLWATDGAAVCTATGEQNHPRMVSDGVGGAIVTWQDYRNGGSPDIYAQRMDSSGQGHWGSDGWAICINPKIQEDPAITSDGVYGAIIAWSDKRNADADIYAQRVDIWGNILWTFDGIAVDTAEGPEYNVSIAPDGDEGAVLSWAMYPMGGFTNIYAQRIDGSGNPVWGSSAMPLTLAPNNQYNNAITCIIPDGDDGFIGHWVDHRKVTDIDIYAQRVGPHGHWGNAEPVVSSIGDVPGDQGGWVNLSWDASRLDWGTEHLITRYTLWRALSPTSSTTDLLKNSVAAGNAPAMLDDIRVITDPSTTPDDPSQTVVWLQQIGSDSWYWELVASVDAYQREHYAKVVETAFDSTSVSPQYHYFQVLAHTSDPSVFWESAVDSCRSVDNLAPAIPSKLAGQATEPSGLLLTWSDNTETDLASYRVYRGMDDNFVPGPSNLLATVGNNLFLDAAWTAGSGYVYKVSARDIHENESGFATLAPDEATAVEDLPTVHCNALYPNVPNPFNPRTMLAFEVAEGGPVSLRVYDTAGRVVRTLVDEVASAGRHEIVWDGRNEQGSLAASGAYFVQLKTTGFTQSQKVLLSK